MTVWVGIGTVRVNTNMV